MTRLALALLLFTSLCYAQDEASARAAAGCGPKSNQFGVETNKSQHPIAQPDPAKATVYVFGDPRRAPTTSYITSIVTRVGVDGSWVGANRASSYFYFTVEAGEHRLCVDIEDASDKRAAIGSAMTFSGEAGKSYFFRARYEERFDRPPYLELKALDGAEGMFLVSSSAHAKSTPKK